MSSGPVGLDVREYVYAVFPYTVQAGGFQRLNAFNAWLVTKVQLFAGANPAQLSLSPSPAISVAANGCVTLEPNGAFKGPIDVLGEDAVLIVEYWFQAQAGKFAQGIQIVVTT